MTGVKGGAVGTAVGAVTRVHRPAARATGVNGGGHVGAGAGEDRSTARLNSGNARGASRGPSTAVAGAARPPTSAGQDPLRVAVSGVSHWHAPMHLRALTNAGANLVGVADPSPQAAREVAEDRGVRAYQALAALVEATRPDLVVALGKPRDVLRDAEWLVEHDVPCVVEKPIGTSGADLAPLVHAASERNAFVAVPLVNRYSPLWRALRDLEAEGRRGDLVHAHFRIVNGPASRYEAMGVGWMLDGAASGGGSMRNLGIHCVEAFTHFTEGDDIEVVGASATRQPGAGIETFAAALLRSAHGVIGTIEAGYSMASQEGSDAEWRVSTTNAYLVDKDQRLRILTLDDGSDTTIEIPSVADRYDRFMADTIQRLRSGRPPVISLHHYARASLLIDTIYASATQAG